MTRTLTSGVATAIAAGNTAAVILIEMDFGSGTLRVSTAPYSVHAAGDDWIGVGALGTLGGLDEATAIESRGISLEMSGIDPANIALALGSNYQGRAITIWVAVLNPDTHVVIDDPVALWSGRMDTMSINLDAGAVITLTAESRLADLKRPRARRYNSADQQIDYPTDLGFDFVPLMVTRELPWGVAG